MDSSIPTAPPVDPGRPPASDRASVAARLETARARLLGEAERYREQLRRARQARAEIDRRLAALEAEWRAAAPNGAEPAAAAESSHHDPVEVPP